MKLGRPRLVAGLVLAGVFALGAVGGVVGAGLVAHRHIHALFDGPEEVVESRVTLGLLEALLRMTPDERVKVRAILDANAVEHTKLRSTIEPQLTALREKERAEIRAVLTPEQQTRLDKAFVRIDARRARIERILDK